MKKEHQFKLIDGEFSPSEARSILSNLVSSKISFHSAESFRITIKTSGDTSFHEKRIKELKQTTTDIKQVMAYAAENNMRIKINGTMEVRLINEQR